MANQNVQYSLNFTANTTSAKAALQDLFRSLDSVNQRNIDLSYIDADLQAGAAAARQLKSHLEEAVNVNTGKLNLNDLEKSLKSSGTSLADLSQKLLNCGDAGQKAFSSIVNAIAKTEIPIRKTNSLLNDFAITMKNTFKWQISSNIMHGLESSLNGAVSYAKNLNTALTDIRIVTGQSADDMARFAASANKAAQELKTTTTEYAKASLIYFQQGDSDEVVKQKTDITIKAANASSESTVTEMSDYLTAVWNSYQVANDKLESTVDIMAALGARTATSMEEIASAMQKVASVGNSVGVDFDQLSSIISTVSSVTRQSAESIGTSFKTILARLGDLKLGKTDKDGVGLGTVSSQLETLGIHILDVNGEMRDMGTVIEEIGAKWQTMNRASQTALAQAIAGKRQYTQLVALFDSWDMYENNMAISADAEGALQKMQDTYTEGWEAASNKVKASLEDVYNSLLVFNDSKIIAGMNVAASAIDAIGNAIESLGGVSGILMHIGNIALYSFKDQVGAGIDTAINKFLHFRDELKDAKGLGAKISRIGALAVGDTSQTKEGKDFLEILRKQKEMMKDEMTTDKYQTDAGYKIQLDGAYDLLEVREKLITSSKKLTAAQQQTFSATTKQLTTELNQVQELNKAYEKRRKDSESLGKRTAALAVKNMAEHTGQSEEAVLKSLEPKLKAMFGDSFTNSMASLTSLADGIANVQKQASQLSVAAEQIENLGNSAIYVEDRFEALETAWISIQQSLKAGGVSDGIIEGIKKQLDAGEFQAAITSIRNEFNKLDGDSQQLKAQFKSLFQNTETGASMADDAIDQLVDELVELVYAQKTASGAAEEHASKLRKLKKDADSATDSIGNKLANGLAKGVSILTGFTTSLSAGTSLMRTFGDESSSVADKVGSVMGSLTDIASAFVTGGLEGGIAAVVGTAVGAVLGQIEKAEKELEEERARITEESSTLKNEIKSNNDLVVSFNELLEAKGNSRDVDSELVASAKGVIEAHGQTANAVDLLSGSYDNLIKKVKEAARAEAEANLIEAKTNMKTAETNLTNNTPYITSKPTFTNDLSSGYFVGAGENAGANFNEAFSQWLISQGYDISNKQSSYLTEDLMREFVLGYTSRINSTTTLGFDVDTFDQELGAIYKNGPWYDPKNVKTYQEEYVVDEATWWEKTRGKQTEDIIGTRPKEVEVSAQEQWNTMVANLFSEWQTGNTSQIDALLGRQLTYASPEYFAMANQYDNVGFNVDYTQGTPRMTLSAQDYYIDGYTGYNDDLLYAEDGETFTASLALGGQKNQTFKQIMDLITNSENSGVDLDQLFTQYGEGQFNFNAIKGLESGATPAAIIDYYDNLSAFYKLLEDSGITGENSFFAGSVKELLDKGSADVETARAALEALDPAQLELLATDTIGWNESNTSVSEYFTRVEGFRESLQSYVEEQYSHLDESAKQAKVDDLLSEMIITYLPQFDNYNAIWATLEGQLDKPEQQEKKQSIEDILSGQDVNINALVEAGINLNELLYALISGSEEDLKDILEWYTNQATALTNYQENKDLRSKLQEAESLLKEDMSDDEIIQLGTMFEDWDEAIGMSFEEFMKLSLEKQKETLAKQREAALRNTQTELTNQITNETSQTAAFGTELNDALLDSGMAADATVGTQNLVEMMADISDITSTMEPKDAKKALEKYKDTFEILSQYDDEKLEELGLTREEVDRILKAYQAYESGLISLNDLNNELVATNYALENAAKDAAKALEDLAMTEQEQLEQNRRERQIGLLDEAKQSMEDYGSLDGLSKWQREEFASIMGNTPHTIEGIEYRQSQIQAEYDNAAASAAQFYSDVADFFKEAIPSADGSEYSRTIDEATWEALDAKVQEALKEYLVETDDEGNRTIKIGAEQLNEIEAAEYSQGSIYSTTPTKTTYDEAETIDYLEGLDSQFKALDAYEMSPKVENLRALGDALDLANPKIAEYYNNLLNAENAEQREAAIDDLTTAILTQGDAYLTNSQGAELILKNYKDLYGITDELGNVLSTTAINTMKVSKRFNDLNKNWKKAGKTVKAMNKEYDNMTDLYKDIAKEAKKTGKSIGDVTNDIEGLTEEEKELIKQASEEYTKLFGDFETALSGAFETLPENVSQAITNMDLNGLISSLIEPQTFGTLLSNVMGGSQQVQDAIHQMTLDNDAAIRAMGEQLQAAADANGSIDLGTILQGMGVDVSNPIAVLEALKSFLQQLAGTPYFEGAEAALGPVISALSAAQGLQNKYGGGGGGAKNANTGSGKGKGGGGGSKSKTKEDKLRAEDEIERYHEQNEVLDRVGEKLDAIDKLKDRTYGKNHLAQLDAETEALKEQLAAQADLYNEANKWRASDQKKLINLEVGVKFDADGNIANYEEVMAALIEKQNANIERYNNSDQDEGDKAQLEADKQWYEDAVKAIENYEEALKTGNEALIEMEEIRNQISELELEKITYKLEVETELNDNDLELLEYYMDKWEDDLDKQANRFMKVTDSITVYQDNLANLNNALTELNEQHQNGTINEADYTEGVQDIRDQIMENLENLEDAGDQLKEIYSDALELAREEIEKTTDAMQHSSDVMENYISIMGLMGKANDFEQLQAFYDAQYTYGIQQIGVLKSTYDTLIEARAEYDAKIEAGQKLSEVEQANYDALQEKIRETEEEMLDATESTLEAIKAGYENTVNAMSKDLEEFMVGAGNSIAGLADQYAYFQEKQDRYVSTAKELFEVSKLNRDIENSLTDATTDASKEALKALQEKINKQSELNELTEYDIQMNQLEYQLLLARIQLEEASSSKDTVRLTRDENGNYAYQYTADQDKVNQAMQQYEDVLQQINELSVERTGEIEQQMIDAMQNNLAKFNEIMSDETLSTKERNDKIADLNTQFGETMLYLQEQAEIAGEKLTWNQEMIADHFGVALSDITASTAGNVNESVQAMIDRADEFAAKMNAVLTGDGEDSVHGVWDTYKNKLKEVSDASGLNYESMTNKVSDFTHANDLAAGKANEVLDVLKDTLTPLTALTAAWGVHAGVIQDMVQYYESLANAMNEAMRDSANADGGAASAGGAPASTGFEDKGYGPYEVTMPDGTKVTHNATGPWSALAMAGVSYADVAKVNVVPKFYRGGLVDFTGLAQLDGTQTNPELVLNADDTRNMLETVRVVRQLDSNTLSLLVSSLETSVNSMMAFMNNGYHAFGVSGMQTQTLDQNVQITAEFPNVTDHNEIEEAFNSLVNRAAQFAKQK